MSVFLSSNDSDEEHEAEVKSITSVEIYYDWIWKNIRSAPNDVYRRKND